jgi:hypothetical protein
VSLQKRAETKHTASAISAIRHWYGAVGLTGVGFGLVAERRPLGDDMLAHPLVLYFLVVAVGLIVVRMAAGRPVPEIIPERALAIGCAAGLALFLAANFVATHLTIF